MRSPLSSFSRPCIPVLALGLSVALGSIALGGCASNERPARPSERPPSDTTAPTTVTDDATVTGIGTIRYIDLEGGFYGLVATDGTKYDPTPLPDRFQVDGLSVRFRVKEKDTMTTRMWGTPVDVLEIERIDDENE